jgi:uncharacterized protein YkwD
MKKFPVVLRLLACAAPIFVLGCASFPDEWMDELPDTAPATGSTATLPPSDSPRPPVSSTSGSAQREVATFATLANDHRRAIGCGALVWHEATARLAQAHSEDMGRRGYFSHTDPEGRSPFDRMREAGVSFGHAAENIAAGQATAQLVLATWIRSSGHRANLENCTLTHHGAGFDGQNWTHLLLTLR